ncbi:MAG TPA: hypothetical protein VF679_01375 [Pedobacter sp.]
MSDPNSNPERPNMIQIQFFRPVSRDKDVMKFYKNWNTDVNLRWTIEKGVAITWESTDSVLQLGNRDLEGKAGMVLMKGIRQQEFQRARSKSSRLPWQHLWRRNPGSVFLIR